MSALLLLLVQTFSACVTPPQITGSQVLPDRELKLIATVKRGKDYSLTNRFDLAELEFRKALAINPNVSSIYNDLGFTLQSQDRLEEAAAIYQRALDVQPKNIIARENLGRVFFAMGDMDKSLVELEKVLETYDGLSPTELKKITGSDYGPREIREIYRQLAMAYYRAGKYDEALCYSEKTLAVPIKDFVHVGQHARLLLLLGEVEKARDYLRDVVIVWQGSTPPELFIDYGIALYETGQQALAKESFARALAAPSIQAGDRRNAGLLSLLIQVKGKDPAAREKLKTVFLEKDREFCSNDKLDSFGYWPSGIVTDAKGLVGTLCHEQN